MKDKIKNFFTWLVLLMGGLKEKKTEPQIRMTSNPLLEWPRNYKCVCGSGKKFKACCLPTLSTKVTFEDAEIINEKLNKYRI